MYCEDGIGINVSKDTQVGRKGEGFDPMTEYDDARGFADNGGNLDAVGAELTFVGLRIVFHSIIPF